MGSGEWRGRLFKVAIRRALLETRSHGGGRDGGGGSFAHRIVLGFPFVLESFFPPSPSAAFIRPGSRVRVKKKSVLQRAELHYRFSTPPLLLLRVLKLCAAHPNTLRGRGAPASEAPPCSPADRVFVLQVRLEVRLKEKKKTKTQKTQTLKVSALFVNSPEKPRRA